MFQRLKPALQSSKGRSLPWGGSKLINCFAEQSEGDKAELYAVNAIAGTSDFFSLGVDYSVRGIHRMGNTLYAVLGTTLYSIASNGTPTSIGTITGTKPVRMADNGTELAIHNGDSTGYVLSGGALAIPVNLGDVSDVCFIDSYFAWSVYQSDQWIISGINNGTSYDPLDIATAEASPDQITGINNDHRELQLFGGGTSSVPFTEFWVNTGDSDFPFERQSFASMERGCIDRDSIVKLDNTTFFVGDDRIAYRMNGYTPLRISTHAVEKTLAKAAWFRAFTYAQEGHRFYVLNTDQGSWVYDITTSAWHQRQSFGLVYWGINCATDAYGETVFGDGRAVGKLYTRSLDSDSEAGNPIPMIVDLPPVGDGVNRQTLYAFEAFMETGVGDLATTDPQAILTYSRDGGRNWSNEMWRSLGAQGEYATRAVWRVNVEFRQLQLRLQLPSSVRRCIIGYQADIR